MDAVNTGMSVCKNKRPPSTYVCTNTNSVDILAVYNTRFDLKPAIWLRLGQQASSKFLTIFNMPGRPLWQVSYVFGMSYLTHHECIRIGAKKMCSEMKKSNKCSFMFRY